MPNEVPTWDESEEIAPTWDDTTPVDSGYQTPPVQSLAPRSASILTDMSGGSVGELRRREGAGEIAAGEKPFDAEAAMQFAPGVINREVPERPITEAQRKVLSNEMQTATALTAGLLAPGLLPARLQATSVGGSLLQRLGANALAGGVSGVGSGAVNAAPQLAEGDVSGAAKTLGTETAIGTFAGPIVGEVARPIISIAKGALSAGSTAKNAVADLFRPTSLNPDQLRMLRSVDTIKDASGVDVPLSLAEAIGSKAITRRMGLEGAEPTAEQMTAIYELALHRAANTPRGARTPQEISRQVFDILDPQRQGIEQGHRLAVEKFAAKAAREIGVAEQRVGDTARKFFPSGRGTSAIGEDAKLLADDALESARADFNSAYSKATSLPEYQTTLVDLQPVRDYADSLGLTLVKDSTGKLSVMGNTGANQAAAAGSKIQGTATLDEARNLVSELSKAVRQGGVLPGVDIRAKAQMAQIAAGQVDSAVSAVPALQTALGDANKLYRENIGRFRGAFSEGILSDVGEAGGLTGEAIMSKLTGANAETALNQFTDLLGSGATAGKNTSAKGLDLVREAVLSTAAKTGRMGGEVNVGRMVGQIEKLPDAVRNKLFPNYKILREAMIKESSLPAAVKASGNPEQWLKAVDADAATLQKALGATEVSDIQALAKQAVMKDAAVRKQLSSLSLDKLGERSAFDIQKFALDPNNQSKLGNLVKQLETKNPDLLRDVQSLFIDDLLQSATKGDVLDPKAFHNLIASGTPAGPGTAGRTASKFHESVATMLGPKGKADLERVAKAASEMPVAETASSDQQRGFFNYLFNGYQGGNVVSGTPTAYANFFSRLFTAGPEIRYRFASKFLTDDSLRRKAMQPITDLEAGALNKAVSGAVQSIRSQFGKDSEQFKDARLVEDALP